MNTTLTDILRLLDQHIEEATQNSHHPPHPDQQTRLEWQSRQTALRRLRHDILHNGT